MHIIHIDIIYYSYINTYNMCAISGPQHFFKLNWWSAKLKRLGTADLKNIMINMKGKTKL